MGKREDWIQTKKFCEALGISTLRGKRELVRKRGNESAKHYHIKSLVAYILRNRGHSVLTEVELNEEGAVTDVIDLDTQTIVEIERDKNKKVVNKKLSQYSDDRIKEVFVIDADEKSDNFRKALKELKDIL